MATVPKSRTLWRNTLQAREVRLAWVLLLPTGLIVLGLVLFPAIFSIWISFRDVGLDNLGSVFTAPFVGLDNFKAVFNDFAFKFQNIRQVGAAVTTIAYAFIATILTLLLGLIAALLLNRPFTGRGIIRGIFLFPYVAPIVSIAFVWRWILDPRPSGVLNDILMKLSLIELPKAYLATRGLALVLVIVFTAWRYFPFAMLMILARLQAIDQTMYEAADVDGANTWHKFLYITIPELRYVLGSIFLLRLIWTFNKFDDVFLLTGGGAGTEVITVKIYDWLTGRGNVGAAAALGMVLAAILIVLVIIYFKFFYTEEETA